ncbi:Ig-like domain-containing protein [Ferrimonas lipolytica]|uniref:Cadherin-like domain-containing protein n=1 Tax=Ferrimonas lipolytica TaxID=2724191 RepID=A0A6H1UC43_9GAMM|nr:Ig-like domain-containing protein [Ferrimonas lipolytica]QIZ75776.1 cadherin-like domain-containing protein [Ferrimonas lipolytica]
MNRNVKSIIALAITFSLSGCNDSDSNNGDIQPINGAPIAVSDTAVVTQGEAVIIDVLANDDDPDGDALTVVAHPELELVNGSLVYQSPMDDSLGVKEFEYRISDGELEASATVTVTVEAAAVVPPPEKRGDFAGSERCQLCHSAIYNHWQETAHGTVLRKLYQGDGQDIEAPWGTEAESRVVYDVNNHRYSTFMKGDEYWVTMHDASDDSKSIDMRVDVVGYSAQLLFFNYDPTLNTMTILPLSYWPKSGEGDDELWTTIAEDLWFSTDGATVPKDQRTVMDNLISYESRCADCHVTAFEVEEWVDLPNGMIYASQTNIWESEFAIGCEKCHGPAAEHAATGNPALVVNPTDLSDENLGAECIQCHQSGTPASDSYPNVEMAYKFNPLDITQKGQHFNVGDNLSEFYTFNDRAEWLDTGYKRESKSYFEEFAITKHADSGMICSTCHNPHTQELRFDGDEACVRCHESKDDAEHTMMVHAGAQCIDCHMPYTKHSFGRSFRYETRSHAFTAYQPADSLKVYDALAPFTLPDADPEQQLTQVWAQINTLGTCYENWKHPANMEECTLFDIMPNACSSCHSTEMPEPGVFNETERQKLLDGIARYQRFLDNRN